MPVVGIYTKDFPLYGSTITDSTIIVVAETGNPITYRTTVGTLRSGWYDSNPTTAELTITDLNTAYPSAGLGFEVICEDITDNPLIYKKTATSWRSIPLGGVSP